MTCEIDHLVVSSRTLAEGAAWVEGLLGVPMAAGGKHPLMGTHNMLLSLGAVYLEVIAVDPDAAAPGRPRWFDLDRFTGAPRLSNWVARCADLEETAAVAPRGVGEIMALERGDLRWRMAVPEDGRLPYGGVFPGLIEWAGAAHPAARLPEVGCRLEKLVVTHPRAGDLAKDLARLGTPSGVEVVAGQEAGLRAEISGPGGRVVLE